tara:strand:+ start:4518 stop:4931 length:414 start_codon:yes stop_codon:yes gene_type:complete
MNSIDLFFSIRPESHQSFRVGRGGIKYKPKKIVNYQKEIISLCKKQLPDYWVIIERGTPIICEYVHYSYSYLKSIPIKKRNGLIPKVTKPDLQDNLNKALFDALEGIIYEQDQNIVEVRSMKKFYSNMNYIKLKFIY